MRTATRHEDDTAVVYTFAEDGDSGQSVFTIYKTDPMSYRWQPSEAQAVLLAQSTWQELVAAYDRDTAWTTA